MLLINLFVEFFKVGLFSVGGGLATLPFLYDMSDRTGWFDHTQLANMIAISESTPGAMGVNMATYVGFTTAGFWGMLVASVGLVTPSFLVIMAIVFLTKNFRENQQVQAVFKGIRPVSMALIAVAGYSMFRVAILNVPLFEQTGNLMDLVQVKSLIIAVPLAFLIAKKNLHPIAVVGISGIAGIILF